MSIILKKDTFKNNISSKRAIAIMVISGSILFFIILFNILILGNFDEEIIKNILLKKHIDLTHNNILGFVRNKIIIIIFSNTVLFAGFFIMVWIGINKKRYGYIFGVFWMTVFGTNAISTPFYFVDGLSVYSILTTIGYGCLSIIMFMWVLELKLSRTRLRIEIARKRIHHNFKAHDVK